MSMPPPSRRPWSRPAIAAGCLVLTLLAGWRWAPFLFPSEAAIRAGDVRRYATAKAPLAEAPAQPPAAEPRAALAIRYDVPEGWTDRGASGMRLATLAIGPPESGLEVTVIPAAGTLEANVGRWLGQLAPQADPATIERQLGEALAAAEKAPVGDREATIVLLPAAATPADGSEAILGAMIPIDATSSLFVKFKGAAETARQQRDNFRRFVSSIRWQ